MIHVILICYHNPEQTLLRWTRDVKPAVALCGPHSITVVDNSPTESHLLRGVFGDSYLWQNGENLMYGGAINLAVPRHPEEKYVLYVCTKHGRMLENTWVQDMIMPMERDDTVGATGFLMGSNSPEGVAHDCKCPWVKDKYYFTHDDGTGHVPQHLQGGVFAARTELMLRFPYPKEILHLYTDHILTWEILKARYKCVNVPSILSVWRNTVSDTALHGIKFVHADNHT